MLANALTSRKRVRTSTESKKKALLQHKPWPKKPKLTPGENGSPAFTSTGIARLDLFGQLVRDVSDGFVHRLADAAWKESAENTLQIAMNCRDIRAGKGERTCSIDLMLWIRQHKPLTYKRNLNKFLELGCFRDLLVLADLAEEQKLPQLGEKDLIELELIAYHLSEDRKRLWEFKVLETKEETKKQPILSLAAKWAPGEKKKYGQFAPRLAKLLFPTSKCMLRDYRLLRSALNKQLKVTETLICQNKWSEINFSQVPAACHKKLRAAFAKHAPEEYKLYKEKLATGEKTIKSTGVMPHELVAAAQKATEPEIIDAQWKNMIQKLHDQGCKFTNSLAIVDVSGSMSGLPLQAAIAIGLVISELTRGVFHNRFITFSDNPLWHVIEGKTLAERVESVNGADWNQSTNLEAAFRLILDTAVEHKVPAADLPRTLFILSDMQFNEAVKRDLSHDKTWLQNIGVMYKKAGYERPNIVFWNLRATENFPVTHDDVGVCMLSGFSPNAMKVIMEKGIVNPLDTMLETLKPYDVTVEESERGD